MRFVCKVVIHDWALMIAICLLLVIQTHGVQGKSLATNKAENSQSRSNNLDLYSAVSEADVGKEKLVKRSASSDKSAFATDFDREERFWGWIAKGASAIYKGVKNAIDKRHG